MEMPNSARDMHLQTALNRVESVAQESVSVYPELSYHEVYGQLVGAMESLWEAFYNNGDGPHERAALETIAGIAVRRLAETES